MELVDIRKNNSIFDEMKNRLYLQKLEEISFAHKNKQDGELEEALDEIESDYIFNLSKLEYLLLLKEKDEETRRKFVEQKMYISCLNTTEKGKIQLILTTASLLNKVNTTKNLTREELNLLAMAMVSIPTFDYELYCGLLSNPQVLQAILSHTDVVVEQLDICNDIFDYIEEFYSNQMTEEKKQIAIKDSINIINKYQLKSKGKSM